MPGQEETSTLPMWVCVIVHMLLKMIYVCRFQNSMLYKINMHYLPSKNLKDYDTTLIFWIWFWCFSRNWFYLLISFKFNGCRLFFRCFYDLFLNLCWLCGSIPFELLKLFLLSRASLSIQATQSCPVVPFLWLHRPTQADLLSDAIPKPTFPRWRAICPCPV